MLNTIFESESESSLRVNIIFNYVLFYNTDLCHSYLIVFLIFRIFKKNMKYICIVY